MPFPIVLSVLCKILVLIHFPVKKPSINLYLLPPIILYKNLDNCGCLIKSLFFLNLKYKGTLGNIPFNSNFSFSKKRPENSITTIDFYLVKFINI